ncbi:MAG: hypothetical protein E7591_04280 [Ruminococcaceae bacterium]|nr:hypothetical protein [Oscillospiraceae bacterium]
MKDPKIYLAIDNCFGSKRWTEPIEWMNTIKELGLYYVESSADTECDPLYMGDAYMKDWADKVNEGSDKTGVKVANIYSGHGTYATLGLAHTDIRVRERFLKEWLMPMVDTAKSIGSGFGFFCHAFSDSVLQDAKRYAEFKDNLINDLGALAAYAKEKGCGYLGVEQMYSPHQIPWTVEGAREMIREIYKRSGAPMYITVDVGHQSGQRKFVRLSREEIAEAHKKYLAGDFLPSLWLGTVKAFEIFEDAKETTGEMLDAIESEMDSHSYMFAPYKDGDPYEWLRELGGYSPIVHLQQTNGSSSGHQPFTKECNEKGIITGEKVIEALKAAYSKDDHDMPEKCDEIVLTLEMFTGTADINRAALQRLRETVAYWRQFIPRDGMKLSEL